jgi:hypothetical protein
MIIRLIASSRSVEIDDPRNFQGILGSQAVIAC